jgi:NAD(P)-dependent dehydrogenase (short-subunit alcohol dehydrogenase family)
MTAENGPSKSPSYGPRLLGRVAVVTGGSRGMGLAIARSLASEGCDVVISGRSQHTVERAASEIREAHLAEVPGQKPKVLALECDVRDEGAVQRMFAGVAREFGRLDILVNNAGIFQSAAPVEKTDIDLWRDIIDINLTGTFLCTRAALPLIKSGGTILNIISVAARDSFAGYAPYNASKAGALSLTRTLREELKTSGIRVTAILPGATDTEIWQQVMPGAPRDKMIESESVAALVLEALVLSPKANLTELVLDPVAGAL